MKSNLLSFHLPILHINLVSTKNNRNVLTHPAKISVPRWDILVSQACSNIKHNNGTLPMNIVTIPEATKLLLPSRVPTIKANFPTVCEKIKRMDFNTNGSCTGKRTLAAHANPNNSFPELLDRVPLGPAFMDDNPICRLLSNPTNSTRNVLVM